MDVLVAQGTVTPQQVAAWRDEAKEKRISIEKYLVEKKIITAEQLAKAYAEITSFVYIEAITEQMADLALLAKAPLSFLRDNQVMPVLYHGSPIIVAADPFKYQPMDELNLLLDGIAAYGVATPTIILNSINRYYPLEGTKQMIEKLSQEEATGADGEKVSFEEIEEKDIMTMAAEAPVIKLVNHVLYQAVKRGASDIHIEPFEKEIRVRYRIDGIMYDVMHPPKRVQGALVSRIKIMSHLDIAEKRIPQDGRITVKVGDKAIDIRVSVLPVNFGERVVMRLLDKTRSFAQLESLGLSERDYKVLTAAIERPNGIMYVTGPTGSGKTTTLYSILSRLNDDEVNIITVEDPVEYQMSGIGQVQVYEKVGMTFAAALRSILRQDPDIVMIGETRDVETAEIAIRAALTGHLVLSTLHTNDAPSAITRLVDMGVEPFLVSSSVTGVLAQRLVRKLCGLCKKKTEPTQALLDKIGIKKDDAQSITFYEPIGCDECGNTGYKGRLPVFEIMEMTPAIAQLTMQKADTSVLRAQAMKDGMTLLLHDGIKKIKQGLTTIDEVLAVAAVEYEVEP